MRKLLVEDVLKSPGKLLALCLVIYLATMSFFVGFFLCCLCIRWARRQLKLKAKALDAAAAEAARERADQAREQALRTVSTKPEVQASQASEAVEQATPVRHYARSAVVIPLKKTGTQD